MLKTQSQALSGQVTKSQIRQWYQQCRQATLALFEGIDHSRFCRQAHPDFSPIGWHLGHIAFVESVQVLHQAAGIPAIAPHYHRLFAADSLPKRERANLPTFEQVCDYLNLVRDHVFQYLDKSTDQEFQQQARIWNWLLQHESQHAETIALILELQNLALVDTQNQDLLPQKSKFRNLSPSRDRTPPNLNDAIEIPSGYFTQGYDGIAALDNETPAHAVYLDSYRIDREVVTRGEYREFMRSGGYSQAQWWSEQGWQWLQKSLEVGEEIAQPLYWKAWQEGGDRDPVCGISWYEADAYARFVGKRLPTESEWEKAATSIAHAQIRLGNVWEWTSTPFHPYPNFKPFPYAGYSSVYFDDQHFVLKGGSWATQAWASRPTFRNWYHPHTRQIFAGLRCVSK
jgi:gamma-glutamyl hercynylcysteine S-oxide synthase